MIQGVTDLRILASVPTTTQVPRKGKCLVQANNGGQRHHHISLPVFSASTRTIRVPYASYNTVRITSLTRPLCKRYGGLILYILYIYRCYIMHILQIHLGMRRTIVATMQNFLKGEALGKEQERSNGLNVLAGSTMPTILDHRPRYHIREAQNADGQSVRGCFCSVLLTGLTPTSRAGESLASHNF